MNNVGRIAVNGKLLTVRQSEKFLHFMQTSEGFKKRYLELSSQVNDVSGSR